MRRAVILIVVLMPLSLGLGLWTDISQQRVAREYLSGSTFIRALLMENNIEQAQAEQAYLHAKWQQDAKWLNCIISHHHTRAVTTALIQLATALDEGWEQEQLKALDQLEDALRDVEQSDFPYLENIL